MLNNAALDLLGPPPSKEIGFFDGTAFGAGPGYRGPLAGPAAAGRDPYQGASRFDAQIAMWSPWNQSADMEVMLSKYMSDARAKDAARNDSMVDNAIGTHKDSIVGALYMLNSKPNRAALGLADKGHDNWEAEFQEEVEALWVLDAESNDCWLDASRSLPFTGMVRLAVGIYSTLGEVLATAEWIKKDKSRPFKTAVQFIDTDRLVSPPGEMDNKNLRKGIYRDDYGAPLSFNICDGYPNDPLNGLLSTPFDYTNVPVRTPWGREQVIYLKDKKRPDQTRGVSMLISALKEWKMTKGFRDVTLQNAIVNATYAASIESEFPDEAFQAIGAAGAPDMAGVINDYAGGFLAAIEQYAKGKAGAGLMLDGVKIPHLFPGTKLQLRPAGSPGGVGTAFEDSLLRYLAAALGVSYEQLSKNYTNTNYSSIRAAMAETFKHMQSRKRLVADRFATSTFRLWFEEKYNQGAFTTLPASMPGIYIGSNLNAYTTCDWIGAARGQIDELKETQGAMLRIASGISTLEIECGRLGFDWRQIIRQTARERDTFERYNLVPPNQAAAAQNTNNANSATPHTPSSSAENANDNN